MALADIDVTSFPVASRGRLLGELFVVSPYGKLIGKLLSENNGNLPIETSTELLQVALALHVRKKENTISVLRQEAQVLRDAGVAIFPEITNLDDFTEGVYTSIKAEAIATFTAHKLATEELLAE